MGNILPILISYKLHKEYIEEKQPQVTIKKEEIPLLKEEKRKNHRDGNDGRQKHPIYNKCHILIIQAI